MFPGFVTDGAGCLTLLTWPLMALVWVVKAPVSLGTAVRTDDTRGFVTALAACACLLLLGPHLRRRGVERVVGRLRGVFAVHAAVERLPAGG